MNTAALNFRNFHNRYFQNTFWQLLNIQSIMKASISNTCLLNELIHCKNSKTIHLRLCKSLKALFFYCFHLRLSKHPPFLEKFYLLVHTTSSSLAHFWLLFLDHKCVKNGSVIPLIPRYETTTVTHVDNNYIFFHTNKSSLYFFHINKSL